jgi:predicted phosphoribosyltransferase
VPIGREIADALGAPLDVLVARRLGAPRYADIGIGAIAPGGTRLLDTMVIRMLGVTDSYVDAVTLAEREVLEREVRRLRAGRPVPPIAGRTVVLVDDGGSTRWRSRAALAALRRQRAARLVFAVPVCASDARDALAAAADVVVCPLVPERFYGAAAYYDDFSIPTDDEVRALLTRRARRTPLLPGAPPPSGRLTP